MSDEHGTESADIELCKQCKWYGKPHCPLHGKDVSDVMYCGSWEEVGGAFQGIAYVLKDNEK